MHVLPLRHAAVGFVLENQCGVLMLPDVRPGLRALIYTVILGLAPLAAARPLPAAPRLPPPPGYLADRAEGGRDAAQGRWADLPPAEREAIRRLSQEQREALARRRDGARQGQPPGERLTPEERRRLRELIREEHERSQEHERHSGRMGGGGRRP